MKIIDLMIGDLVRTNPSCGKLAQNIEPIVGKVSEIGFSPSDGHYITIAGHKGRYYEDEVEPIPLSGEVLEEFGLHQCVTYSRDYITNELQTHRHDTPMLFVNMQYEDGRSIGNQIHYVHELQHAMKLCRIDKEIVDKEIVV